MKRCLFFILLFMGIGLTVHAQQLTIRGRVLSVEEKTPLPGVSVRIKGTTTGSITDAGGNYTLNAASGQQLIFSFVGYSEQTITVGTQNIINVNMRLDQRSLNEVVISQGITRDRKSLGYSSPKVEGKDLTETNRENFITGLQGRVPGATITPTSGMPGASAQIILRGAVSMDGDNQPLFVVDGLPISNRTLAQSALYSNGPNRDNDYTNRAADINPEDIESVTILTGPEAAALYGTDGASGVILITTKKAKSGRGSVTYNGLYTVSDMGDRFPEIQSVYDQGSSGQLDNASRSYFGPKYAPGTKLYNNVDGFFRTAFSHKHDVSFEGGTEKASFRLSPSYSNYAGVVPNTSSEKFSVRLAASAQIMPKLTVDASFTFFNNTNLKGSKGANSLVLSLLTWPQDDDASNYLLPGGFRKMIAGSSTTESDNPHWDVNKNKNNDKTNRFLGNVNFNYKFADWLTGTARIGTDIYTTDGNRLFHPLSLSGLTPKGKIENYTDQNKGLNLAFVLNAKKSFGEFSNNLSLGFNYDNVRDDVVSSYGERFYSENFNSINNTDPVTRSFKYYASLRRKFGWFGNLNVGYGGFLYLSLTGRVDASSTLYPNPYFVYPGAGLSFVFSELLKNKNSALSMGKFRMNYAYTGKDPRVPFILNNRLVTQPTSGGGFALDVTLGNPYLRAEFTKDFETGLELEFYKNRLTIDVSFYRKVSDKQITAPRLSYATEGILKYINGGTVINKGLAGMITVVPVKQKNFEWSTTFNYAMNRNEITRMPAELPSFYISDTWLYAGVRAEFKLGTSITNLSSQGHAKNKDGKILIDPQSGMPIRDANYIVRGERAPDFTLGWVNRLTYKNLSLQTVFDMRRGGDIFNGNALYLWVTGLSPRTLDREAPRVVDGVLRDGKENSDNPTKNTIAVTPYYNSAYYNGNFSEEDFIEKDINWFKIQDVSLSYRLPSRLFTGTKFFRAASVNLSASNLVIITNYTGVDPSVSGLNASSGGYGANGIDYGALPSPPTYTLGLRVQF